MKMKEKNESVDLKLKIQKTKFLASGPITSWQIDGETMESFIFLGSKITPVTAAMKLRHLLPGRKAMVNPDSILKKQTLLYQQSSI